ncbi:S41 family peptidase [Flavobacterium sp.]|uniref:S41 family peptidase n=1 Tax=Flavobacterium sp. TaxID=239 RepID=UPI0026105A80|nr:S41 family peptidase [Flavobacterium sp.]MDD3003893.1 S41 family peptidase [Flavobacterium sp.]
MKYTFKLLLLTVFGALTFYSCDDNDDSLAVPRNLEVQNFIWKGLNLYYLWQEDSPDLADDRFATQEQLNAFLTPYTDPLTLFNHLRVDPAIDRFSVLVDDYVYLENLFQGVAKSNGMEFTLRLKPGSETEVFGAVNYIIPNSDAANKNLTRGMLFYAIDNQPLTINNYRDLIASNTYTLNLANYDDGAITPNGQSVELTKTELTENPIFLTKVIETNNQKVGYLMYNGFTANYDLELNDAFGTLKAAGVTDLVLDLRYNGGGSVLTATRLASMITGQFNEQLFAKQQWNSKIQAYFEENNPSQLVNNFTNKIGNTEINSLNLSKVYILTTGGTASASELVINGLKPYIQVIQIGTKTIGKNVGSVTLYDSPTFNKQNVNPRHKYAMQPIVIKTINKDGFGDYQNGIVPDINLPENAGNLGVLGNENEPLLNTALGLITGDAKFAPQTNRVGSKEFKNSKSLIRFGNEMYIDNSNLQGLKKLN